MYMHGQYTQHYLSKGAKTFAKDVDIQANLMVSSHIDTVDINDLDDNAIKLSSGDLSSTGDLDFSGNIEVFYSG